MVGWKLSRESHLGPIKNATMSGGARLGSVVHGVWAKWPMTIIHKICQLERVQGNTASPVMSRAHVPGAYKIKSSVGLQIIASKLQ